ncbi:MAG: hypothetical protein AVDCRST_MAG14-1005 [uncultured Rubrobacteraceae bacterium]|uniref:DUF6883 domain-containing protein n=1 Tax=uncultured Rubrobacteraceae bacterium TaxID=349277 RepID=A0A6J4R035_9ACTN|nr:MAG: hypothetical protein AVDCRST_MAG14-1005 [uncultured Rubrobacteraceae bacterium]
MPESPTAEWFAGGIIEGRKLEEYLLSPTHPVGKHKLRLWRSLFGVREGDGKLLERLIREQLIQAEPRERRSKVVGHPRRVVREWEIIIPRFRGPNGNEGPVLTAWALDPLNDRPHLSTAYPLV